MKRALITGGGSGIGRTLAERFHDNGYAVTICGRKLAPLEDTAKGRDIRCYQADVTSESDIEALFDAPYDIVVANAGGGGAGKLASLSLEEWNTTLAVNLTGTFLTFRQALCHPAAQMRLIAIASTASLKGNASVPAYTAAKHGVLGLVRSIALEMAKTGRTCNAICPGFTETALSENAIMGLMERFDLSRDAALDKITAGNPQRRLISPDEIAATALFLASAEASAINGHALSVSGGEI